MYTYWWSRSHLLKANIIKNNIRFQLNLIKKEKYISFLLSILLFVSIDISFNNYIVLGKENDDDNSNDEDKKEKYEDEDNEVPFKLPFNAVPFP